MDPKIIHRISNQVYRKFPEVRGKKPRVRAQAGKGKSLKPKSSDKTYLLTFRGYGSGPGGKKIPRLVRVVARPNGKIVKMSTSRG